MSTWLLSEEPRFQLPDDPSLAKPLGKPGNGLALICEDFHGKAAIGAQI